MAVPRVVSRHLELITWILLAGVFLLDVRFPAAAGFHQLYTVVILLGLWTSRQDSALRAAAVATALHLLDYVLLHSPADSPSDVVVSRGLDIGVMWITAIGITSYRRTVAGRLASDEALRRSVKDLDDVKRALDQSAIVATTDVRGTITYVNDKFCEISKYSREELIGRNHRILNSSLHPLEFFKEMYYTIANGQVWRAEIRNRAKDGGLYWVDTTIVPFVDDKGHPYQYIAIRYDITERKRSEAALREQAALAQLGKMAAVVAHEVRNPLAGIRGAVQVIGRRMTASSPEHGIINEIVARIDTLNDIVQDLLLFARPKPPVLVGVPLRTVIDETISLLKADPKVAALTFAVHTDGAVVQADPEQLKLVLLNLFMNGAQAMQGRGEIRVQSRRAGAWHELRIIDQGPGIPPEVRAHLFEPFFTTKHRGTGLGLATARRIIEGHGGTIELESPEAGGTTAVVRLRADAQTRT